MPTLYTHIALVECADERGLDELLAAGLNRYLVRRLGPRAIVVDHERLDDLKKLLKRLGQTPRITVE